MSEISKALKFYLRFY